MPKSAKSQRSSCVLNDAYALTISKPGCTRRGSLNTSSYTRVLYDQSPRSVMCPASPTANAYCRPVDSVHVGAFTRCIALRERRIQRRKLRIELGVLRIEIARGEVEIEATGEPADHFELRPLDLRGARVAHEVLRGGVDRELHILVVVVEDREVRGHAPIEPAGFRTDLVALHGLRIVRRQHFLDARERAAVEAAALVAFGV